MSQPNLSVYMSIIHPYPAQLCQNHTQNATSSLRNTRVGRITKKQRRYFSYAVIAETHSKNTCPRGRSTRSRCARSRKGVLCTRAYVVMSILTTSCKRCAVLLQCTATTPHDSRYRWTQYTSSTRCRRVNKVYHTRIVRIIHVRSGTDADTTCILIMYGYIVNMHTCALIRQWPKLCAAALMCSI